MSNNKVFVKSAIFGYINMIAVMLIGIISQPIMLKQLGVVEFGIWSLTLNLLTYIGNSNVGIPAAALVYISKNSNSAERKSIVIKAFKLLVVISACVFIIFIAAIHIFPHWYLIMGKFDKELYNTVGITMTVSVILFLIRSPLQLAQSAFGGFQDVHITKIYELLNTIVPFIGLILITVFNQSIIQLSLYVGFGYIVINLIGTIHLSFKYKIFDFIFKDNNYSKTEVSYNNLFRSGFEFFFLGIGFVIIYNTDNLVISNLVGIEKVTNYNFAFKLYQMAVQVMNIFTGIALPLYGRAYIKKDFNWIRKIYNTMLTFFPIFAGAIWIGGILVGRDILDVWSGDNGIFENYLLMFALGGFVYSLSAVNVHSTLLSGIDKKKESVVLMFMEAITNLAASIILSKFLGIAGIALGTLIASVLIPFMFLPRYVRKNTNNEVSFNIKVMGKHFAIVLLPLVIVSYLATNTLYEQIFIVKALCVLVVISIYLVLSYVVLPIEKKQELIMLVKKRSRINKRRI